MRKLFLLTLMLLFSVPVLASDDEEAKIKAAVEDRYKEWIAAANKKTDRLANRRARHLPRVVEAGPVSDLSTITLFMVGGPCGCFADRRLPEAIGFCTDSSHLPRDGSRAQLDSGKGRCFIKSVPGRKHAAST